MEIVQVAIRKSNFLRGLSTRDAGTLLLWSVILEGRAQVPQVHDFKSVSSLQ